MTMSFSPITFEVGGGVRDDLMRSGEQTLKAIEFATMLSASEGMGREHTIDILFEKVNVDILGRQASIVDSMVCPFRRRTRDI